MFVFTQTRKIFSLVFIFLAVSLSACNVQTDAVGVNTVDHSKTATKNPKTSCRQKTEIHSPLPPVPQDLVPVCQRNIAEAILETLRLKCYEIGPSELSTINELTISAPSSSTSNNILPLLKLTDFQGLTHLKKLTIDGYGFSERALGTLTSLEELTLSNLPSGSLPENFLAEMSSLKVVYINNTLPNHDLTLPLGLFTGSNLLTSVVINGFRNIPEDLLADLPALKQVSLGEVAYAVGNSPALLKHEMFCESPNIETIEILGIVADFSENLFADLTNLKEVKIQYIHGTHSLPQLFKNNPALVSFELNQGTSGEENSITFAPRFFSDLPSLSSVSITESSDSGTFHKFPALFVNTPLLSSITLQGGLYFSEFEPAIFQNLPELKYINLAGSFVSLPPKMFDNDANLKEILIEGSAEFVADANSFMGASSVQDLKVFDVCPTGRRDSFCHGGLKAIPSDLLNSLTQLKSATISGSFADIPSGFFWQNESLNSVSINGKGLEKIPAILFKTAPESVNFSHNSIRTFPTSAMGDARNLALLDLAENRLDNQSMILLRNAFGTKVQF